MEPHRDNRYETISCSSRTSSLAAPPPPHSRAPRAPCVARSRLPPPPRAAKSSFVYAWRRAAALNLLSLSCSSFAASKCPACFKARILKVASTSTSFHPPPRKVLRLRRRLPLVREVFFTCIAAGAGSSAFVQNSTRAGIMLNKSSTSHDYIIE